MNVWTKTTAVFLFVAASAGLGHAAGLTTRDAGYSTGLVVPPGIGASAPVRAYQKEVGQQLYDRFGAGSHGRTLYCNGSVAVGFQIMPDGRVRHVKLLRRADPSYNGRLVAVIANTRFPRFRPGMATQPLDEIYRYGVAPLAVSFMKQRFDCR